MIFHIMRSPFKVHSLTWLIDYMGSLTLRTPYEVHSDSLTFNSVPLWGLTLLTIWGSIPRNTLALPFDYGKNFSHYENSFLGPLLFTIWGFIQRHTLALPFDNWSSDASLEVLTQRFSLGSSSDTRYEARILRSHSQVHSHGSHDRLGLAY